MFLFILCLLKDPTQFDVNVDTDNYPLNVYLPKHPLGLILILCIFQSSFPKIKMPSQILFNQKYN